MHGKNHPPLAAFRTGSTKPAFARVTYRLNDDWALACCDTDGCTAACNDEDDAPPEGPAADPSGSRSTGRRVVRGPNGWARG